MINQSKNDSKRSYSSRSMRIWPPEHHPNAPKKNFKEIIDEFIAMSMPFKKRILLISLYALFYYFYFIFFVSSHLVGSWIYFSSFLLVSFAFLCVWWSMWIYIKKISRELKWTFTMNFFIFPQTTIINLSILTSSIYHINKKKSYQLTKIKKNKKIMSA